MNCRGLSHNWENFETLLSELHSDVFSFDFVGVSEAYRCDMDTGLVLPGYHPIISRCRSNERGGGVAMFIKSEIQYKIRDDLSIFLPHIFESVFIETSSSDNHSIVVGVIYRPNSAPRADLDLFSSTLCDIMTIINSEQKTSMILGDMNIDLKYLKHKKTNDYLDNIFSLGYLPVVTKPTRVCASTATLIDHIYSNNYNLTHQLTPAIVLTDVADNFSACLLVSNRSKRTENKKNIHTGSSLKKTVNFTNLLNNIAFTSVTNETCASAAYDKFMDFYMNAFNCAFPIKKGNKPNKKVNIQPWASPEFT